MTDDGASRGVEALRESVALGCRILFANGHDDYIWGHLSARDTDDRGFWMKASGLGFDEIGAEDVILVDYEGEILEGDGRRHAEWPIHGEILRARPDLGAVVHSHPPNAIALICAQQELRPLTHAGTLFVPPAVPLFEQTSNLIVQPDEGAALAATLGDQNAAFIINHGVVTCGGTVEEAVVRAVMLESACRQQVLAQSLGEPIVWPDDEESLEKRALAWPPAHFESLWRYLARKLEKEGR